MSRSLIAVALLMALATAGFAFSQDGKEPGLVLFLGDSLTAGYGLDPLRAFPALIQEKIDEAGMAFEVLNAGLSGETSAGGLRRVDWVFRRKVDVLVLELGANDGLRGVSVEHTRFNLERIIETARRRSPDIRIVLAGMMIPPNLGPHYTEQFRDMYRQLAEADQVELIPFLLEGVAGRPELNQSDGIHPTAEGHKVVADVVWKTLKPILESVKKGDS